MGISIRQSKVLFTFAGDTDEESYGSDDAGANITLSPFQRCKFYLRANTTELGQTSYAEVNTSQSSKNNNVLFIVIFSTLSVSGKYNQHNNVVYVAAPGKVGKINATTNESAIQLNWDPPDEPNGIVILYTVTWNEVGTVTDNNGEGSDNATSSSYDVTGLKAYTTYNISIAAWTEVGSGDPEYIQANTDVSGNFIIHK